MNNKNTNVSSFLTKKVNENEFDNSELIVTHNLSADELLASFNTYNGILAPSIAISGLNAGLEQYGEITVVFDKSVLSTSNNGKIENVYDVDFYSKTFPEVEYDLDNEHAAMILKSVNDLHSQELIAPSDWEIKVNKGFNHFNSYLTDNDLLKCHFLKESGIYDDYVIPMKNKKPILDSIFDFKKLIAYITKNKITHNPTPKSINDLRELVLNEINETKTIYFEDFEKEEAQKLSNRLDKRLENIFNKDEFKGIMPYYLDIIIRASEILNKKTKIINKDKLEIQIKRVFKKNNLEMDYKDFVNNITENVFVNKHFKVNDEKLSLSEKNILEYFKTNEGISKQDALVFSMGKARSSSAKKMTTLESVYENRDSLTSASELEDIVLINNELFDKLREEVFKCAENNDVWYVNNSCCELLSVNASRRSDDSIFNMFKKKKLGSIDDETINIFRDLNNKLHTSKVDYFEAKPIKKVEKKEIVGIVVPRNLNKEDKKKIKELGIKVTYYDNEIESRNKAVKSYKKHAINQKKSCTPKIKRKLN
jgi:hypothetical protein